MLDMIEIGVLRQNLAELTRRTSTDKDFRTMCLENANAAYFELTGQDLPEWYLVRFFEPTQEVPHSVKENWVRLPRYITKTWID